MLLNIDKNELIFLHSFVDLRFPLDGAVELHFSPTPDTRLPSPAPTPAIPVDFSEDRIVRYDSYENLGAETTEEESDQDVTGT